MGRYVVNLDESGRVLIPEAVRRQLHLVEGETDLIMTVDEAGIAMHTRLQAIKRVQAELRKYVPEGSDVVGEFLAERRREAAEEDAKQSTSSDWPGNTYR